MKATAKAKAEECRRWRPHPAIGTVLDDFASPLPTKAPNSFRATRGLALPFYLLGGIYASLSLSLSLSLYLSLAGSGRACNLSLSHSPSPFPHEEG